MTWPSYDLAQLRSDHGTVCTESDHCESEALNNYRSAAYPGPSLARCRIAAAAANGGSRTGAPYSPLLAGEPGPRQ